MFPFPAGGKTGPARCRAPRPHSGVAAFRAAAVGHKVPIREVRPKTTCLPEKMIPAASRSVREDQCSSRNRFNDKGCGSRGGFRAPVTRDGLATVWSNWRPR